MVYEIVCRNFERRYIVSVEGREIFAIMECAEGTKICEHYRREVEESDFSKLLTLLVLADLIDVFEANGAMQRYDFLFRFMFEETYEYGMINGHICAVTPLPIDEVAAAVENCRILERNSPGERLEAEDRALVYITETRAIESSVERPFEGRVRYRSMVRRIAPEAPAEGINDDEDEDDDGPRQPLPDFIIQEFLDQIRRGGYFF